MGNAEPKTVRELYFYTKGEFKSIKKMMWMITWITGSAIIGIILNLIKGWIK